MVTFRYVEQGIAAIQSGQNEEGARLLRIALKDPQLVGGVRAVACLWLAETTPDPNLKRQYYDQALAADPTNPDIRHRVEQWLATQLPRPPDPAAPPPPSTLPGISAPAALPAYPPSSLGVLADQTPYPPPAPSTGAPAAATAIYQIARILDGPNGPGTAFFVHTEGLLATTRFVVGTSETVQVELDAGTRLSGQVLRSFPEMDLAFIYIPMRVQTLMPISPLPRIPADTPLLVLAFDGSTARGRLRATHRALAAHWFPTDITQPLDAGGNPVLDDQRLLVGMLTNNTGAASSFQYGLHIRAILARLDFVRQELRAQPGWAYCPACGANSPAAAAGGYYCETCGSLMPRSINLRREANHPLRTLYHENYPHACRRCGARVGIYRDHCLRCGGKQSDG